MKTIFLYALMVVMAGFAKAADLPKVASLKAGEQLVVNMTLYGYTITKADFIFSADGVSIQSEKVRGELLLTTEDRMNVDKYLNSVMRGEPRVADQEGYEFVVSHSQGERKQSWKFAPVDVPESEKPALSLHDLQNRLESELKELEFDDPSDAYFSSYLIIRKAEELEKTEKAEVVLKMAKKALQRFQAIKSRFPDWKTEMVDDRIKTTKDVIDRLSAR